MSGTNDDYMRRLRQDGRDDLIKRIADPYDKMKVYAASVEMGYRKSKSAGSRADQITYHWKRASLSEKIRFVHSNWQSVAPIVRDMNKEALAKQKTQAGLDQLNGTVKEN